MYKQFVLGLLFVVSSVECAAHELCAYADTAGLSADSRFQPAIKNFLGSQTFHSGAFNIRVADRALQNFGGPPADIATLADGMVLATGCRAHDCGDKVAVIIACPSKIVAVAVVDYNDQPLLEVFSSTRTEPVVAAFDQWKTVVEGENNRPLKLEWHTTKAR